MYIFAPVCRHTSVRALLWKALGKNWYLGQCDVTQAYLWADNMQSVRRVTVRGVTGSGKTSKNGSLIY